MNNKYRMADVFELPVIIDNHYGIERLTDNSGHLADVFERHIKHTAHAINTHDAMQDRIEDLEGQVKAMLDDGEISECDCNSFRTNHHNSTS